MKLRHISLAAGFILIVVGLFLGAPSLLRWHENASVPKVAASPFAQTSQQETTQPAQVVSTPVVTQESTPVKAHNRPVRLQIPSLGMDLTVADGYYNASTQKWTLSNNKAHYAVQTPVPNAESGNTFIYGHNRKEVFRKLSQIKLGAEVVITTGEGRKFVYVFKGALETTPDDSSVFAYSGPSMLTIQTCSGVRFENRQMFLFDFKEVR